ncbi:MAG: GNAT family N-acetyltransferase [Bryobacterales bacterium]|nr:GNAT family N-acetyltransferase [Bryobacterales bacterium]
MLVVMVSLRKAQHADLAFLMTLEEANYQLGFTGRDLLEDHHAALADDDFGYWIIEAAGRPAGFAILAGLASQNRSILIKRIAVSTPGHGHGRLAMRQLMRLAFVDYNAHRLWLDVYPENERARAVYRALGFQEEGVMRDCIFTAGAFRSLILMSILEHEPAARELRHA